MDYPPIVKRLREIAYEGYLSIECLYAKAKEDDPRGAAANLSNGVKNILFEASDWRGNRATLCVSFTVDNKAKPPEPPKPKAPTVDMMGPEGEMVPPGEMAPAMP